MTETAIYDGHAHWGTEQERAFRRSQGIITMVCAGTPPEAARLMAETEGDKFFLPAAGLHPWHSAEYSVEAMLPYLEAAPVIGEIGMDSVWCRVPMETQRAAFKEQLEIAGRLKKPVVLHTKGMEEEIGEMIAAVSNRYLVHWYSSMDHLDRYLKLGCYFTLGPDLAVNPAVRQVAERAPADRLMVETDGFSAVTWALGDMPLERLPGILRENMELTAQIKGLPMEKMAELMKENFLRFIKNPLQ